MSKQRVRETAGGQKRKKKKHILQKYFNKRDVGIYSINDYNENNPCAEKKAHDNDMIWFWKIKPKKKEKKIMMKCYQCS